MPENAYSRATRLAALYAATLAVAAPILAGCGSNSSADQHPQAKGSGEVKWLIPPRPIPDLGQRTVGGGARAAVLLWRAGRRPPRDAIVFLHAWQPMPPYVYGAWLRHLAREGNTIVYPVIQGLSTKPEAILPGALAGVATGLRAAHASPDSVVAVGDNTGGALAFDYAALAGSRDLPAPRGVLAIFPGRNPPGGEVTLADLSRIAPHTLLEAIAGSGDPIPDGEAQARALLQGARQVPADHRRLLGAPAVGRGGPMRPTPAARRAFWVPADRLIAEARGEVGGGR